MHQGKVEVLFLTRFVYFQMTVMTPDNLYLYLKRNVGVKLTLLCRTQLYANVL